MASLSSQQLYDLTNRYFGDLGPDVVNTMYNIALRESGGNPSAYNGTGMDNSYGLWQINTHAGANPDLAIYDLTNPEQNAAAARIVYDRQGPTAWSTYTGGGGSMPQDQSGVINALVNSLATSQPKPSDFQDQVQNGVVVYSANDQYQEALAGWMQSLQTALELQKSMNQDSAGIFQLGDGSIITQQQMDALDPQARAQVQAQLENQRIDRENKYNDLMNNLGLTEFTTGQNSSQLENSRRSQDFQNQLNSYREKIALDQANQDTATKQVDRQLAGMQESRARATSALDALMQAAPWGTSNGKTSFSPADFGSLGTRVAQLAGINPNAPALNYTGVLNVDPNSMYNYYDQQLGVTGQLPQIPGLTTTASQIPQAPGTVPIQLGAPAFRPYTPPAPTPLPQASAFADIPDWARKLLETPPPTTAPTSAPAQQVATPSLAPPSPLITPLTTLLTQALLPRR